jgi:hypothetical protein
LDEFSRKRNQLLCQKILKEWNSAFSELEFTNNCLKRRFFAIWKNAWEKEKRNEELLVKFRPVHLQVYFNCWSSRCRAEIHKKNSKKVLREALNQWIEFTTTKRQITLRFEMFKRRSLLLTFFMRWLSLAKKYNECRKNAEVKLNTLKSGFKQQGN